MQKCHDFQRKNKFFKKLKFLVIRAAIFFMQTKYNDPGSNLSLQTFVHKVVTFYFWCGVGRPMMFGDFSCFPDSFWWISTDLSTN